jgi:zinc transporter, ZIP family
MSFLSTVILGGIAGLTIYLGLPVARLKNLSRAWQAFLGAVAVGILIFLLWDVLSEAIAPIEEAIGAAKQGEPFNFISLLALFGAGLGIGLLSLVYFDRILMRLTGRHIQPDKIAPARLALMIAGGIGLHNFSEGLAIGQASRAGAISLAAILIVGFGLHNATEGFGVAAPLTSGERPTWRFLGLLGLIAGGPTFLGTVVGFSVYSQPIFVLCLALAAGSILYVVAELLKLHPQMRELTMWGILIGFLIAYGTDLILMWGGA